MFLLEKTYLYFLAWNDKVSRNLLFSFDITSFKVKLSNVLLSHSFEISLKF